MEADHASIMNKNIDAIVYNRLIVKCISYHIRNCPQGKQFLDTALWFQYHDENFDNDFRSNGRSTKKHKEMWSKYHHSWPPLP